MGAVILANPIREAAAHFGLCVRIKKEGIPQGDTIMT